MFKIKCLFVKQRQADIEVMNRRMKSDSLEVILIVNDNKIVVDYYLERNEKDDCNVQMY